MSSEQQKTTWIFFMLTAIRKRLGIALSEFVPIEKKFGLISFLFSNYELLHYYDNDYIVNDTLKYIEEQGGDASALLRVG